MIIGCKEGIFMFSNRDLRKLIVPLVIDQILAALMGIVDTMMVANVSEAAVSAVSLVDSINQLFVLFFAALTTGGTVICAQQIGTGNTSAANHTARQLLWLSAAVSLALMLPIILLRGPLLRLIFGTVEAAVMRDAMIYFLITLLSYPFLALFSASVALYRASGNSRLPMLVSAGANLMNIAGNAVMIFGFHLGAAGAALATLASRMVSAAVMLILQHRPGQVVTVDRFLNIRPEKTTLRLILKIGLPNGLENAMFQIGKLAVQSTLATLGTSAIAAQAVTYNMEYFTSMPSLAVGMGALTVVGRCMGAGRPDEAKRYTRKLIAISEVTLVATCLLIVLASPVIIRLSGLSAEAAALSQQLILIILAVKVFIWVPAFTLPNSLRAAGDVKYPMVIATLSMWLCRVGLCVLLCRGLGFGLLGIWIGMWADWLIRGLLYIVRYRGGKWAQLRVLDK